MRISLWLEIGGAPCRRVMIRHGCLGKLGGGNALLMSFLLVLGKLASRGHKQGKRHGTYHANEEHVVELSRQSAPPASDEALAEDSSLLQNSLHLSVLPRTCSTPSNLDSNWLTLQRNLARFFGNWKCACRDRALTRCHQRLSRRQRQSRVACILHPAHQLVTWLAAVPCRPGVSLQPTDDDVQFRVRAFLFLLLLCVCKPTTRIH